MCCANHNLGYFQTLYSSGSLYNSEQLLAKIPPRKANNLVVRLFGDLIRLNSMFTWMEPVLQVAQPCHINVQRLGKGIKLHNIVVNSGSVAL